MGYRVKYWISLVVFTVGCLLVVAAAAELQGSFGIKVFIESGLWKMGIGLPLVILAGPAFYYFRSRKKQSKPEGDAELRMLAALGKKRLEEQETAEKRQNVR